MKIENGIAMVFTKEIKDIIMKWSSEEAVASRESDHPEEGKKLAKFYSQFAMLPVAKYITITPGPINRLRDLCQQKIDLAAINFGRESGIKYRDKEARRVLAWITEYTG